MHLAVVDEHGQQRRMKLITASATGQKFREYQIEAQINH